MFHRDIMAAMIPAPKCRRFRFSLRTLFAVVTVAGIILGWIGFQLNWIKERRQAMENGEIGIATTARMAQPVERR